MKKITIAFFGLLFIAISCTTNEVGHDATDQHVTPNETSPKEEKVEETAEVQVPVSEKNMETDFRLIEFFTEGESNYIKVCEVTYEEDENATWGRSLGVPVISKDTLVFKVAEASYFDCAHNDQVMVDSIESKWKKEIYLPIRIKTEAGIVKEFYYDECSG